MMLELDRAEYKWFKEMLTRYSILAKSHVFSGTRIDDSIKNKIEEIIMSDTERDNLVPLSVEQAEFFLDILEEAYCCCPKCSLSSVQHRKAISLKILDLLQEGAMYDE